MPRDTLLDFFHDFSRTPGVFLVYDDGFRTRTWTYGEVAAAAERLAVRLARHGVGRGDKVVVWGENRPEWVVAFWGCLLRGAVVVPIDYRASADFLVRVRAIVEARVVLVGDEVRLPERVGLHHRRLAAGASRRDGTRRAVGRPDGDGDARRRAGA